MSSSPPSTMPVSAMPVTQFVLSPKLANQIEELYLVDAIGYTVICGLSTALVLYLRRNRAVAFRGDSLAARKLVLPSFMPLLMVFVVVSLLESLMFWIIWITYDGKRFAGKYETELYSAGRQFIITMVIICMYQKSLSVAAQRRAAVIAIVMSLYVLPIMWITTEHGSQELAYWVPMFARVFIVLFYLWVLVNPPSRASPRTLREYASFVLMYYVLYFTYNALLRQRHADAGYMVLYASVLWGSLCPLVIWRVLQADTEYWRGLGLRACTLQSLFRQRHQMNEYISSRGLHVLIEMHRHFIIDFAYLEFKHQISVGDSTAVFSGLLHSKTPVAIKVYTPTELNDDVVGEFSHEAALCGVLSHPNIVKFYGMCVRPPTICLVSELCMGNLAHVTQAIAQRSHNVMRQQLLISINYMIDASRAVAYLHSFSPSFLHRDIKPTNFMVDDRYVVKLTDFGESRFSPQETEEEYAKEYLIQRPSCSGSIRESLGSGRTTRALTVRGTADYMAPEMIQGRAGAAMYGEAVDIFSLSMTFWDILYPMQDKYPEANGNHFQIFERVTKGQRPPLNDDLHPMLRNVLRDAWDADPERRPTAVRILRALQEIQQELSVGVAMCLSEALETEVVVGANGCVTERACTGEAIVHKIIDNGFVDSPKEAVRMGNGFMCADLLHHERHSMAFDNTNSRYVFDDAFLERLLQSSERQRYVMPLVTRIKLNAGRDSPAVLVNVRQGRVPSRSRGSKQVTLASWEASESGACLCRRLGAGTEAMSQHHHRRFRHYRKAATSNSTSERMDKSVVVPIDPSPSQEPTRRAPIAPSTRITIDRSLLEDDANLTTQLLGHGHGHDSADTASYSNDELDNENENENESDQFVEMV